MNLLQDQLKAVRLNNGTSLTRTLIMSIKNISQISLLVYSFGWEQRELEGSKLVEKGQSVNCR